MPDPGSQDAAGRRPSTKGNAAEPKGKRRSRWLRKGLAAVADKLGNARDHPVISVDEQQSPTKLQDSLQRLKDHEIRLVRLQPRTLSEGMIQCSLVIVNLDDTPRYEALSYEWGPRLPELPIMMNGDNLSVRENLWWALHHLQLENETRVLWIDALCIDQENTAERNYQVAQMGKIYSSASRCIAWIGQVRIIHESTFQVDDCELAMEFIKKSQVDELREDYSKGLSAHCRQEHDSLEFLCHRKYWSRLWIIQEILLSSDVVVQCSAHEVSWQALSHIFNNLKTSLYASYQFSISSSAPFRLNQQSNARKRGKSGTNETPPPLLADLVLQFKGSQCEDPRDTVFGLLSLARDCCRQAVPADYSTSPEQICTTLLIHHIVSHLDLADKSLDATADIQELCETIMFDSKSRDISRYEDTSIASASMKAFRGVSINLHKGPTPAGRVIWVVPAIHLQEAFQKFQVASSKGPGGTTTNTGQAVLLPHQPEYLLSSPSPTELEKQRKDLLDIFMDRVDLSNPQNLEYYDHARMWIKQIDFVIPKQKNASNNLPPRQLNHLFLTDMGYSGIAASSIKLGDSAYKLANGDCRIGFRNKTEKGISLDSNTTFLELLSWLV